MIYTSTGENTSLERTGPDLIQDAGEGSLLSDNGSADDDDFYVGSWVSGNLDPEPGGVVTDTSRPLIIYQLTTSTNTLMMVRDGSGNVVIYY